MNKCSLGKHQIKFSVQLSPGLFYCCCVDKAGYCSLDFSQITTGNNSRWLIVNSDLFLLEKTLVNRKSVNNLKLLINFRLRMLP